MSDTETPAWRIWFVDGTLLHGVGKEPVCFSPVILILSDRRGLVDFLITLCGNKLREGVQTVNSTTLCIATALPPPPPHHRLLRAGQLLAHFGSDRKRMSWRTKCRSSCSEKKRNDTYFEIKYNNAKIIKTHVLDWSSVFFF